MKYKLKQDVTVSGKLVFSAGEILEGEIVSVPGKSGSVEVLPAVKGDIKVRIPKGMLEAYSQDPAPSKPENRITPVWAYALPAGGLIVGLTVARIAGGGIRKYLGFGLIGAVLASIPTIVMVRRRANDGRLLVSQKKQTERQNANSGTTQIVKSINHLYRQQTGGEMPAKEKAAMFDHVEAANLSAKETEMLRKYMVLATNLSIYGDNQSLPQADQQRVQAQMKQADELLVKIYRNEKLGKLLKQIISE